MKKIIKGILGVFFGAIVFLFILILVIFRNEFRSLSTLEKVDDYGMFTMTYYGDYGFDDFLKTGASSDQDIDKFVTKRLLHGLPLELGDTGDGCTAFVVPDQNGDIIFARNFDFNYAPSLQLYTEPDNGYASVSTVNLSFAGYSEDFLPNGMSLDSFLTLAAPYLPFDGMNEKGVCIALLAVPEADPGYDENKVTLNTTTAIRLVLDKAASVDEAVELLKQYNIYFSADVTCHYLIADSSGASVIVEYYDGALRTVKTDENYQIASNFIAYNGLNIGEGGTEFDRYETAQKTIRANNGCLDKEKAIYLLTDIGVINDKHEDKLQWSVVYDLTKGDGTIFAHRNLDNQVNFKLENE